MVPENNILKKLEEIQNISDRAAQGAKQGSGGMFSSNENSEYYSTVSELIKQAKAAIHALEHGDQLSQVQNNEEVSSASPGMSTSSGGGVIETSHELANEAEVVKSASEAAQGDESEVVEEEKGEAAQGDESEVAKGDEGEAAQGDESEVAKGDEGEAAQRDESEVAKGDEGEAAQRDESEVVKEDKGEERE